MPKDYSDTSPGITMPPAAMGQETDVAIAPPGGVGEVFPSPKDRARTSQYEYYTRLFNGEHFEAFNIKVGERDFTKSWAKLRYTVVNFAGLISKVVADMLFSEPVTINAPDGDQEYLEGLFNKNHLDIQCYESALSNSYKGDALFKLRVGKLNPMDDKSMVIIEDTTPNIYYPKVDEFNVRANPESETLAWTFKVGDAVYLREEIHTPGKIENKVWKMKDNKKEYRAPLSLLNIPGIKDEEATGVDFSLIDHVVNWKTGDRFFGISDYYDLDSLFYAINNRMSKVDNILDKHSDPILTVPPGILDEKGHVKKSDLGVIEVQEGENGKPEYVVWDASLENAFKQIEQLVQFMYMVGEISPDILGMGKEGAAESGRALKFKLMRTIAKVARKKLYYDHALKSVLYKAQVLAKEYNIEIDGKRLQGEPVVPEIVWADGLPADEVEAIDNNVKMIDAGLKSKVQAIMELNNMDEEAAQKVVNENQKAAEIAVKTNMMANKEFGGKMPPNSNQAK